MHEFTRLIICLIQTVKFFLEDKFERDLYLKNYNLIWIAPENSKVSDSPNLDSKSWFQRWNFKQENINTQNEQDKEKEFTYLINDRPLNSVKADLIHAFLSVSFHPICMWAV